MERTSTSILSFHKRHNPPALLVPNPVQLTGKMLYIPPIPRRLSISQSFFLVSIKKTKSGLTEKRSLLSELTAPGVPSPRQFHAKVFIVPGGAGRRPPPEWIFFLF